MTAFRMLKANHGESGHSTSARHAEGAAARLRHRGHHYKDAPIDNRPRIALPYRGLAGCRGEVTLQLALNVLDLRNK